MSPAKEKHLRVAVRQECGHVCVYYDDSKDKNHIGLYTWFSWNYLCCRCSTKGHSGVQAEPPCLSGRLT
jgi:hypothetical protein